MNTENGVKDLKSFEVCEMLNVSYHWLRKHLDEFDYYQIPGRGYTGREFRFRAQSVENFKKRYHLDGNGQ